MMQKEIIVIGDVELGSGNLTDDFISDRALSTLLVSLGQKSHPVDLVMNGDTFDFLKCPFYKDGKATYPRHITKEISLMKLQNIYRAHERVFKAWKEFVSHPKNNLYFTVGNHDHELVYPEVQEDIKVLLGGTENIHFPGLVYKLIEPNATFLLFSNGKLVCTGTKNKQQLEDSMSQLLKNVKTALKNY